MFPNLWFLAKSGNSVDKNMFAVKWNKTGSEPVSWTALDLCGKGVVIQFSLQDWLLFSKLCHMMVLRGERVNLKLTRYFYFLSLSLFQATLLGGRDSRNDFGRFSVSFFEGRILYTMQCRENKSRSHYLCFEVSDECTCKSCISCGQERRLPLLPGWQERTNIISRLLLNFNTLIIINHVP